ncbi:nucleotidyl transferase AbiEii/AbiGii toxin family protein [Patescibacteria group bacterium]|nr:nucleotidyl transferase AbiEii/AbiGii toxin family protein [Patescibacteria group bacterium]
MITADKIHELAGKKQTTELNIRREYVQNLFLSYFYQQKETDKVFFKGGTALRIIYGSPRFSEDLDFSAAYFGVKEIEEAILNALNEIQRENIKVVLRESKKTSGGFLALVEFDGISINLQVSLREGEKRGEALTVVNDFIPPYTIISLSKDQLVEEKMQALFSRQKPRDFYDLYFMLRANLIPIDRRNFLKKALGMLEKTSINFRKELEQFLPHSQWPIIKNFKSVLQRELQRFI